MRTYTQNLWTWIPVDSLQVHARLFVDPLSMTMVLFVTGISTLIHLYSIGYMKGDKDYSKFFLYMNLFVASMLILVLGSATCWSPSSGWEGVGTCSYWLVSFWFTRDSAASAGKKAFVYNRIGDVGFLLAIFLVFERVHSLEYTTIFAHIDTIGAGLHHRHLPAAAGRGDGEVGPDPPVPLAGRRHGGPDPGLRPHPRGHHGHRRRLPAVPDQPAAPRLELGAALTVAIVGAATAFVAATIACAQQDIKKVLAYSTVSQLGLHVPGHRVRGLRGGHLLDGGPRLLQGAALPRGRARPSTASTTSRT